LSINWYLKILNVLFDHILRISIIEKIPKIIFNNNSIMANFLRDFVVSIVYIVHLFSSFCFLASLKILLSIKHNSPRCKQLSGVCIFVMTNSEKFVHFATVLSEYIVNILPSA